jgi:hypothetical protein
MQEHNCEIAAESDADSGPETGPAAASGAGDPLIQDGRFFFNDHRIIREVTEDQFHLQRSVSTHLYSSVWLYLVAVVYLLGARRPPNERCSGATESR